MNRDPQSAISPQQCRLRRGITLLEVMIAVALFTVAAVMVAGYVIQGYQASRFAMQQSDAINHARKSVDAMVREIREATFSDLGNFPIVAAGSQAFTFYSDIDVDTVAERVRYFLEGSDFKKGVIEPTGVPLTYPPANEIVITLSPYVRNGVEPIFYYYDGNYAGTSTALFTPTDPNLVKLMELRLRVNVDPTTAPEEFTLKSFIQIRNLKDNL